MLLNNITPFGPKISNLCDPWPVPNTHFVKNKFWGHLISRHFSSEPYGIREEIPGDRYILQWYHSADLAGLCTIIHCSNEDLTHCLFLLISYLYNDHKLKKYKKIFLHESNGSLVRVNCLSWQFPCRNVDSFPSQEQWKNGFNWNITYLIMFACIRYAPLCQLEILHLVWPRDLALFYIYLTEARA